MGSRGNAEQEWHKSKECGGLVREASGDEAHHSLADEPVADESLALREREHAISMDSTQVRSAISVNAHYILHT